MAEPKYEIVREWSITRYSVDHYRIRALRNFSNVKAGELGGFVMSEYNLSHSGTCWIYCDAMVMGYARVSGDAVILHNARVYGGAKVYGKAEIFDEAEIFGSARVSGTANVWGIAKVSGNARLSKGVLNGGRLHRAVTWEEQRLEMLREARWLPRIRAALLGSSVRPRVGQTEGTRDLLTPAPS